MCNQDLRVAMLEANVKQYEIAKYLGISEFSLSRKLRYELSKDEKAKILRAIKEITK